MTRNDGFLFLLRDSPLIKQTSLKVMTVETIKVYDQRASISIHKDRCLPARQDVWKNPHWERNCFFHLDGRFKSSYQNDEEMPSDKDKAGWFQMSLTIPNEWDPRPKTDPKGQHSSRCSHTSWSAMRRFRSEFKPYFFSKPSATGWCQWLSLRRKWSGQSWTPEGLAPWLSG